MKKFRLTPLQIIVHAAGWFPLARILFEYFTNQLSANPIQAIEQRTGLQALIFLLLSLACTPVASIFGWKELIQRRKALGNYGFLYAVLHVFTFVMIDYGFDLPAIWSDVSSKPYIIIGTIAFLLLLPLAVTSFKYWMKRLGRNWKRLHKLVYLISPLVVLHFSLTIKGDLFRLAGDYAQPLLYGGIALVLLLLRIPRIKRGLIALRHQVSTAHRTARLQLSAQKHKQHIP